MQNWKYLLTFGSENKSDTVERGIYWFPLGVYNSFETRYCFPLNTFP